MPVSEQVGPDGALWIADWCDKYPCYQNAQADPEGVDRERGRIWRVVYTGGKSNPSPGNQNHPSMNLAALSNSGVGQTSGTSKRMAAANGVNGSSTKRETGINGADAATEKARSKHS